MKKQKHLKLQNLCFWLLALSFLLFTGMHCKKTTETTKEDVLPAETQTGKGTFGCLVNGEVWLPKSSSLSAPALSTTIQFDILNLKIGRDNENIVIGVRNLAQTGTYELIMENSAEYSVSGDIYKSYSGVIIIKTYNKQLNIISGVLNFKAKNKNGIEVVITDGRFDVKYTN
ncbi:DUF6252 family protein [Pedobacter alpinus]|uniref:DUF6252 family protein n=1 Tax=Pedobacter alpinus TaxID=1590643 RepID=A0ABW5TRA2_9SPHI